MTFATGKVKSTTWNRVRLQHVTAVAGVALAVSSLVAIGAFKHDSHQASVARANTSTISTNSLNAEEYSFYVVASEQQRDALIESTRGDDFLTPHSYIVINRSLEDEFRMATTQAELTSVGQNARIIDLRSR